MKSCLVLFLSLILLVLVGHVLYILSGQTNVVYTRAVLQRSPTYVTILPKNHSTHEKPTIHQTAVRIVRRMNGYKARRAAHLINCGQYRCRVESGTSSNGADIAFFNEQDVDFYKKPPKKNQHVLWAFQSKEPPNHIYEAMNEEWDGLFNYSITYVRQSDGVFFNFRDRVVAKLPPTQINFAMRYTNKKPRALWFVSHCLNRWKKHHVWSARVEYVQELLKYMQVDVFTRSSTCRTQLGSLIKRLPTGGQPALTSYTFYLSFESTICTDYITEKFWKVLETSGQTIPVALGGRSIEEYERIAPPNSFIHVRNFTSPEALAKHLKYVAENDDAFNYYHEWRNNHVIQKKLKTIRYMGDYYCYYCVRAHERPKNVWQTFSTDFSAEQCLDVSTPDLYCPYYNISCESQNL